MFVEVDVEILLRLQLPVQRLGPHVSDGALFVRRVAIGVDLFACHFVQRLIYNVILRRVFID